MEIETTPAWDLPGLMGGVQEMGMGVMKGLHGSVFLHNTQQATVCLHSRAP